MFGVIFLLTIIVICLTVLLSIYMYLRANSECNFLRPNRLYDMEDKLEEIERILVNILGKMENK